MSGCVQVPQKQFGSYRTASDETRKIAEVVIADYQSDKQELEKLQQARRGKASRTSLADITGGTGTAAVAADDSDQAVSSDRADGLAQERTDANASPLPYPATFTPPSGGGLIKNEEIVVRLQALEVIAHYNDLLATLAEGKSVDQLKTGVSDFAASIQSLASGVAATTLPGVGQAIPLLQTVAGELEKARLREEFKKAVAKGQHGVNGILDVFIADTSSYYSMRLAFANRQRLRDEIDIRRNYNAMVKIAEEYLAPPGGELKKLEKQVNVSLAQVDWKSVVALQPYSPSGTESDAEKERRTYTTLVDSQLAEYARNIDASVADYKQIVERQKTYYDLLVKYAALLSETKKNMSALQAAIDAPPDIRPQVEEALNLAFAIRGDYAALRHH
jgi:hypothetical protein